MRVKILNWEKYQGDASRYKNTNWFRLENTIWMHQLWDTLSDAEFRTMIFLWCFFSQKTHKTGEIDLVPRTLCRMSGISEDVILKTIRKLCDIGVMECDSILIGGVHGEAPRGVHSVTNTTNTTNITPSGGSAVSPLTRFQEVEVGSNSELVKVEKKQKTEIAIKSSQFIAEMVPLYLTRYRVRPVLDGPTLGAIKRFLKYVPTRKAIDMYQVFLQMDDSWFKTKRHDFATFMANLQTVEVALGTGEKTSGGINWGELGEILNDNRNVSSAVAKID